MNLRELAIALGGSFRLAVFAVGMFTAGSAFAEPARTNASHWLVVTPLGPWHLFFLFKDYYENEISNHTLSWAHF